MKRLTALLMALVMVLGLAGCGGSAPAETTTTEIMAPAETVPEETAPEETAPPESAEVQAILAQSWVPENLKADLDETIRWGEMLDMLSEVIGQYDSEALKTWESIIKSNKNKVLMQRDDGMLAIYEAACVLGIGHRARSDWQAGNVYRNAFPEYHKGYSPSSATFTNLLETAPFEDVPKRQAGWEYVTSAHMYSMGQSSAVNPEPFFEYVDGDTRYDDPLTRREAITATAKLIQAYETANSGGYTIPETDWEDPLLAEAKAAKDAILNSPTTIVKGEELILGQTYTGNAYYVSNSGNDSNDGRSPETPWATLSKVEKAKLNYGDAVFFERGGTWYGFLQMQYGVTYSAYGEGAKPIITGSPQDTAQADQWTLYAETPDGGKIWQYAQKLDDVGVILLNGGEIVAQKAYPMWDGSEYVNIDGELYEIEKELADLMYVSALELQGRKKQITEPLLDCGVTGPLYLRCDAGNPGEIYDRIEMAVMPTATKTGSRGWNAVDNIHFRCYSGSGMGTNNKSNIVCQNCEIDWCGGGLASYGNLWWNPDAAGAFVSGGGLLLFGSELTGVNNYIHDCESKGIAIVVNPSKEWLNQSNILAEGNVVERCGTSALLCVNEPAIRMGLKFENIRFADNYFVNGCYGWRRMNMRQPMTIDAAQLLSFESLWTSGEVLFENNLFYRAAGPLVNWQGEDLQNGSVLPTLRGNTYVQDAGQVLLSKQDYRKGYYNETTIVTSDQAQMEKCVREYLGDATGTVIILE